MQQGINKVVLIGRLGNAPEFKFLNNGSSVANLSIATSERWKDKLTGEKRENTDWHKIVLYNRLAEVANQYLIKGSNIYIEGKLKTRKWQDQTGANRYTTEVIVDFNGTMQILSSNNSNSSSDFTEFSTQATVNIDKLSHNEHSFENTLTSGFSEEKVDFDDIPW